MSYFNYKGHNIYYQEMGAGIPLLMLHGNTASSAMFTQIAAQYAQEFKVILIDFLGYGKSERIAELPEDLWYDQAMQVVCLLDLKEYRNVNLIGTSGGALTAINIALERPDLVSKVIADSFEGEQANIFVTENLRRGREASKHDAGARMFYEMMNGEDWESVVDADTQAVIAHANHIKDFFHKPVSQLKAEVLLTGSLEDQFFPKGYFKKLFTGFLSKVRHGQQYLFENGGHPAMISNQDKFMIISKEFFLR